MAKVYRGAIKIGLCRRPGNRLGKPSALLFFMGNEMHYRNGREAKNGDKVVLIPNHGPAVIGILYDAVAGNDFCNGRIAPTSPSDAFPNLKECLHLDDLLKALPAVIPDSSTG